MEQRYIYFPLLVAAGAFFVVISGAGTGGTHFFNCDCKEVLIDNCEQEFNASFCNQTHFTCDCGTLFSNNNTGCYYDCYNNETCYASELCDEFTSCYSDCHENSTCTYSNDTIVCVCNNATSELDCPGPCHVNATRLDDGINCQCNENFTGNGTTCFPICIDECDQNATCNTSGECVCNNGFTGDGFDCQQICEDSCHQNATCNDGTCVCNENFTGDGLSCELICPEACHASAECMNGVCQCLHGYSGNGTDCVQICIDTCHNNATCLSGKCQCSWGYFGNGTYCEPICEEEVTVGCNETDFEYVCACGNHISCEDQDGVVEDNCSLCLEGNANCNYLAVIGNMSCSCNMTCAKPVHGNWSEWSNWTECLGICGEGFQNRTRNCSNPEPEYGGDNCTGFDNEAQICNLTNPCPIHGNWSEWSNWTECLGICGKGFQNRTRNCSDPEPKYGGDNCTGFDNEAQICNLTNPCPIHGNFTIWSAWSNCNVACGNGTQSRSRTCTEPEPQHGGNNCTEDTEETQLCVSDPCPEFGTFGDWGNWSECSASCNHATRTRIRPCIASITGSTKCIGGDWQKTECHNLESCPGDDNYTSWSPWAPCSLTCGNGTKMRTRNCTNPERIECDGEPRENASCSVTPHCPVDAKFGDWGHWAKCSVTCGSGRTIRLRSYIAPMYNGTADNGPTEEMKECSNPDPCPGDLNYTTWGEWSPCSVTCLNGSLTRQRSCMSDDNSGCSGSRQESLECYKGPCPVDGNYSAYDDQVKCPGTCGSAIRVSYRTCTNPAPAYNGSDCIGPSMKNVPCNHGTACTGETEFSSWGNWTSCSRTCGDGIKYRTRKCKLDEPHAECTGDKKQEFICNEKPCPINGDWSSWLDWTRCSSSCGSGQRSRSRICASPAPAYDGLPCYGVNREDVPCLLPEPCAGEDDYHHWGAWSACNATCTRTGMIRRERSCAVDPSYPPSLIDYCQLDSVQYVNCYALGCPINGSLTGWTHWSPCSSTCGAGLRTRTRNCTAPAPKNGGQDCVGARHEVMDCEMEPCPGEDKLTVWAGWYECSAPCEGHTNRTRSCNDTKYNCTEIYLDFSMRKDCNTELCNVNGSWSEWTTWSVCDKDCGPQREWRQRYCNNPAPQAAGTQCVGHSVENVTCSTYEEIKCEDHLKRHGGWSDWSWWPQCSQICGGGTRQRDRKCTNPTPRHNGDDCPGDAAQTETCNVNPCPVDGNFTTWAPWTNCSRDCGGGNRSRERTCTNPKPMHGGMNCVGNKFETEDCNTHMCPIHGNFTDWSEYKFCSKPCNTGYENSTRSCTKPTPMYDGRKCSCGNTEGYFSKLANCDDRTVRLKECNTMECPSVKVIVDVLFNDSSIVDMYSTSNEFHLFVETYVREMYPEDLKPRVSKNCTKVNNTFDCILSVFFDASDSNQLAALQDIVENPPSSYLHSINSYDVVNIAVKLNATVMDSTTICLRWTLLDDANTLNGFTVFFKTIDATVFQYIRVHPENRTFCLESLEKFTMYKITLSPTTTNGTGIPTRQIIRMTAEDKPSKPPPDVSYKADRPSTLELFWGQYDKTYLHGIFRGYCVYYKQEREKSFQLMKTETEDLTIISLPDYTTYHLQVAVRTTPGCGVRSDVLTAITKEGNPSAAPTSISSTPSGPTSIRVTWHDINDTQKNGVIRGFKIFFTNENTQESGFQFTDGPTLEFELTGLSVWTEYSISVAAFTTGDGPKSLPAALASTDEGTPEIAPEIVEARNISSTEIELKWKEIVITHGNLIGYRIIYRELHTDRKEKIIEVGKPTLSYRLTDLYYFWEYSIQIGGYTATGTGKVSSRTVRTDEELPSRCPEDVSGIAETPTSLTIKWNDLLPNFIHGILLGYQVTVRKASNRSQVIYFGRLPPRIKGNAVYLTGLKAYTYYEADVLAFNSKGLSRGPTCVSHMQRTSEGAPSAGPENIRVTTMAHTSLLAFLWTPIPEAVANGIIRGYIIEMTATVSNGIVVPPSEQVNITYRVRGMRYAYIIKDLIPGSTYEISMWGYTVLNGTKSPVVVAQTCRCPKYIKANWWPLPPYAQIPEEPSGSQGIIITLLNDNIQKICGKCINGHGESTLCLTSSCDGTVRRKRRTATVKQYPGYQDVLNSISNDVDMSFPIQGNKYKMTHAGTNQFVSVIQTPGSAFFTVKRVPSTGDVLVSVAIVSVPLTLLILFLSALAGIIVWALERTKNPVGFPPSFTKGSIEGFWWAYISATTVGYGDRSPITFLGRIFAVIWILTGYCIIAVLTGVMVNAVTVVVVTQQTSIYGSKIAAIQNTTEYSIAIRQNAEVLPFASVNDVLTAVKEQVVDGAILDMYATATKTEFFKEANVELNRLIEYPSGYGIVLSGKMKDCAPLLREFLAEKKAEVLKLIQENTGVITNEDKNVVQEAQMKSSGLFDAGTDAFHLAMSLTGGLLIFSVCSGLFWEYKYGRRRAKIHQERQSTPGCAMYEKLKGPVRQGTEIHFKELKEKLEAMKKKHVKELMKLTKMKKRGMGKGRSSAASAVRLRQMTASVSPAEVMAQDNLALQVMDDQKVDSQSTMGDSFV